MNNNSEKTSRMVEKTRMAALTSHAGSLNLYGSGLFSSVFLTQWTKDNYADYTTPAGIEDSEEGITAGGTDVMYSALVQQQTMKMSSVSPTKTSEESVRDYKPSVVEPAAVRNTFIKLDIP